MARERPMTMSDPLPMDRRAVLASFGSLAIGGFAGCSTGRSERPPAGSLRFANDDDVPHSLTVRVTDVGSSPGDGPGTVEGDPTAPPAQRNLSASTTVQPDSRRTYEGVFTEPVWYAVRFTLDGRPPEDDAEVTSFHPAPSDGEPGAFLTGKVYASGEFSWVVSSTENAGPFDR